MNSALVSGSGVALWLAMGAPVLATEPPATEVATSAPARKPATVPATPVMPASATTRQPPVRKTLDLRIGDVRNYMMPGEYRAALGQPDADKNTVVVEGHRVLVPMDQIENVPPGLFGLWYAAKNPLNAWRLLAPVVHQGELPPPDVVPKPIFRWGP
jgi:hypothetical protein